MFDIKPVTVGGHHFINLSVKDYTQIPPIPTNRDSVRRVPRMRRIFDDAYHANQVGTLTEVAIGIVTQDFTDPEAGTVYKKDEWYVVDGNTRSHYWKTYPDKANLITTGITAKIHYLGCIADVKYAYYPYNNKASAERASEILQGLARSYNWIPRQNTFANGGYKTAIDWACVYQVDEPNVFEAFHHCFTELKTLDNIPKDATHTITKPVLSRLRSQAIIASLLVALKIHPNNLRLHDMIERLSTIGVDELRRAILDGKLDPVQIIAAEYTGMSTQRSNTGKASEPWLAGHAGGTKYESQAPQMNFLLYWIAKYIENPRVTYDFNRGIKPDLWSDAWVDFVGLED